MPEPPPSFYLTSYGLSFVSLSICDHISAPPSPATIVRSYPGVFSGGFRLSGVLYTAVSRLAKDRICIVCILLDIHCKHIVFVC